MNYRIIKESLGIADPTLFYCDILCDRTISEILDYINSDPSVINPQEKEIIFNYSTLRRYVTNWDVYSYFPVSEIRLSLSMVKRDPIPNRADYKTRTFLMSPFIIGGAASPFGRSKDSSKFKDPIKLNNDHSLSLPIDIIFEYNIFLTEMDNSVSEYNVSRIYKKLNSVVLHELNHMYEFYKRKMYGSKDIKHAITWTTLSENNFKRPKVIWNYWQYFFTDFIYMAEPHEVRAQIQEAKAYIDKNTFEQFKKERTWIIIKTMENFSYKDFLISLEKFIIKYNPIYKTNMIENLVSDFKKDYRRVCLEINEQPFISHEKLDKMTTDEFFQYWENKIRSSGRKLVRGVLRIYAHTE